LTGIRDIVFPAYNGAKALKGIDVVQQQDTKQIWERPQLILLGRSNPEERVLTACKDGNSDCLNNEGGELLEFVMGS